MMSWPVTLGIMVLAFGSLVAAGLPLLLTLAGLVASAGGLVLLNEITPISVWAMNFAMMFALALGIDYALFLVVRFRDALRKNANARLAVAETMDTAGKAVLLSGLTVLVSLSAVLLVPAPAVRTMAVGIMLAVVFVLAATLTLLPAVLAKLGRKVNAGSLPYAKKQQTETDGSPLFTKWGKLLDRHPLPFAVGAVAILIGLAIPVLGLKSRCRPSRWSPRTPPCVRDTNWCRSRWVSARRARCRSWSPRPTRPLPPRPRQPSTVWPR